MALIVETGLVIPWAAGLGLIGWVIIEVIRDYRKLKGKVDDKQSKTACDARHLSEENTEKRISEAIRLDREGRHGRD